VQFDFYAGDAALPRTPSPLLFIEGTLIPTRVTLRSPAPPRPFSYSAITSLAFHIVCGLISSASSVQALTFNAQQCFSGGVQHNFLLVLLLIKVCAYN
jgi:hypothetical protein